MHRCQARSAIKRRTCDAYTKRYRSQEADLFIFPELFLSGYMCRDRVHLMAESLHGESVRRSPRWPRSMNAPSCWACPAGRGDTGLIHNSAVLVKPDGSAWSYDKINLATFGPFEESLFFSPGKVPTLFEVEGIRLAWSYATTCSSPSSANRWCCMGRTPSSASLPHPNTSRDLFERIVPARAIENTAYSIYVNNTGCQLNEVFFGGSHAFGPRGNQLVKCDYFRKDVRAVDLDLSEVRAARRMRPTVRDSMGLVSQDLF